MVYDLNGTTLSTGGGSGMLSKKIKMQKPTYR